MSKKHFIALADALRSVKPTAVDRPDLANRDAKLIAGQWHMTVKAIADTLAADNPRFNRDRWLAYIAGECGPNGGTR